jgi:hypothetical protein
MRQKLRPRLTFANVVSMIALFVALGGTGAWATHEAIFSSDIVDGEVKAPDLANLGVTNPKLSSNSVRTGKVLDNNLQGIDIQDNSLTGNDVNEGTLGPVPSATKANSAFSTYHDPAFPGRDLPNSLFAAGNPIVTLSVPAGSYWILSKLWVDNAGGNQTEVTCRLEAGVDTDTTISGLDAVQTASGPEVVVNQVVHTFASSGRVKLYCTDGGFGEGSANNIKITAMEVASLTNTPF